MVSGTTPNVLLSIVALGLIVVGVFATGVVPGLAVAPSSTTPNFSFAMVTAPIAPGPNNAVVHIEAWGNYTTTSNSCGNVCVGNPGSSWSVAFIWGDGTPNTKGSPAGHTFYNPVATAPYIVTATLTEGATTCNNPSFCGNLPAPLSYTLTIQIPSSKATNVEHYSVGSPATIAPSFTTQIVNTSGGGVAAQFHDTSVVKPNGIVTSLVLTYSWNFGDNTTGTGTSVGHTYANRVANYTASETITATNTLTGNFSKATATQSIVVGCGAVVPSTCATKTTVKNTTGSIICGPNGVYLSVNGSVTIPTGVSCGTSGGTGSTGALLTPLALALIIAGTILLLWQWIPFTKPRLISGVVVVIIIGGLIYIFGSGIW